MKGLLLALLKTLFELADYLGSDRKAVVLREATKKFEEILRGGLLELSSRVKEKGEFAVVVEGNS